MILKKKVDKRCAVKTLVQRYFLFGSVQFMIIHCYQNGIWLCWLQLSSFVNNQNVVLQWCHNVGVSVITVAPSDMHVFMLTLFHFNDISIPSCSPCCDWTLKFFSFVGINLMLYYLCFDVIYSQWKVLWPYVETFMDSFMILQNFSELGGR